MSPAVSRKREAIEGSVFPRDLLAANIKARRGLLGLSQKDLAARMSSMRYVWSRPTVSQVETGARPVSADELYGLALALNISIQGLLMPVLDVLVDVGLPEPISVEMANQLLGLLPVTRTPYWNGNIWTGWNVIGGSPSGLPRWIDPSVEGESES